MQEARLKLSVRQALALSMCVCSIHHVQSVCVREYLLILPIPTSDTSDTNDTSDTMIPMILVTPVTLVTSLTPVIPVTLVIQVDTCTLILSSMLCSNMALKTGERAVYACWEVCSVCV